MNCKACLNKSHNCKDSGISFFRFPSDEERCRDWAERCQLTTLYHKLGNKQFYKSCRICSDHFDRKYIIFDGQKQKLLNGAVPELFTRERTSEAEDLLPEKPKINTKFQLQMVEHMCRLCAQESNNLTEIFQFHGKSLSLEEKMKYLPVVINAHDVLPLKICQQCIINVGSSYDFFTNCIKADTKLRIMLDLEFQETTYKNVDESFSDLTNVIEACDIDVDSNVDYLDGNKLRNPRGSSTINEPNYKDLSIMKLSLGNTKEGVSKMVLNEEPSGAATVIPVQVKAGNNCMIFFSEITILNDEIKQDDNVPLSGTDEPDAIMPKGCDLSRHLAMEHDYSHTSVEQHDTNHKVMKFTCSTCQKSFSTLEILNAHNKAHSLKADALGRYQCNFCDKIFRNRYKLNEHLRIHTGESPYKCHICGKRFHKGALLKQHLAIHNPNKEYTCYSCCFRSNRRGNLIQHMKSHCRVDRVKPTAPSTCAVCLHSFPNDESLRRHEIDTHGGVNGAFDGMTFPACERRAEGSAEHDPSPATCGLCLKTFSSPVTLRRHFNSHTQPAKYKCSYCGQAFKSRESCHSHERVHTGQTPFDCDKCDKSFRSRPSLHQHRGVHSDQRKFSCPECGQRFKRKDGLKNHARTHSGERPFSCKVCGFAFKQRGDCVKHERNHTRKTESDERAVVVVEEIG